MNGTPLMHSPRIYAFVQARLSSTRLPHKVLATLPFNREREASILEHIFFRLSRVMEKEKIVFLIPDNEPELESYISSRGWNIFVGSPEDVRSRFIRASEQYEADIVIRVTGDNPLPDLEAVEMLIDAWLDPYNKMDLIYVSGLPLGMSLESFSFRALQKSLNFRNLCHTEHVSLAIKENPESYKIGSIPFLGGSDSLSKLRLTIDQKEDMEVMRKVFLIYLELSQDKESCISLMSFSDICKIYKLNPDTFSLNLSVEQVRFSLPDFQKSKPKVAIVYGEPENFGSGHRERCRFLAARLTARDFHCIGIPLGAMNSAITKKIEELQPSLVLWDVRDEEIPDSLRNLPVLAIDNYSNSIYNRSRLWEKIDLLPHPKSTNWKFFLPRLQPSTNSQKKSYVKQLLVYSGSLDEKDCMELDRFLVRKFSELQIFRVGDSASEFLKSRNRLTKKEWISLLKESDFFLSYFGQSLMEAVYFGLSVATYSISPDHEKLSMWLFQKYRVPFWGSVRNLSLPDSDLFMKSISLEVRDLEFCFLPKTPFQILNP